MLYFRQDFIEKNPNTTQALVNAFYKTLKWLEKATPEEIAATVPEDYYLGDKPLYIAAVKANKPVFANRRHSSCRHEVGGRHAASLRRRARDAKIDLAKTFDERFVKKAAGGRRLG